ncbi:hypothetical protein CspHIS471_0308480 [Cutaneotrichosporon sp. HIS471]|nr:hypothetical protein CspHIS471_0308480 [Cutaneotrichosporon sp. HIS471]
MLTLAWLVGLLAVANKVAAITYPITLDSYSPQLVFSPFFLNSTEMPSWNESFKQPNGKGQGYQYAEGVSNTNAVLNYTFYGSDVEFFGYWGFLGDGTVQPGRDFGTVTLTIVGRDGQPVSPGITVSGTSTGQPASMGGFRNLPVGYYTASLRPVAGSVSFTHLVAWLFSGDSGTTDAEMSNAVANPNTYSPCIGSPFNNSLYLNPDFGTFRGPAGTNSDGGWIPMGGLQGETRLVQSRVLGESISTNLGVGNSFLSINVTLGPDHGHVGVTIEPAPPGWGFITTRRISCGCPYRVYNAQLVTTGLDPSTEYNVTLTNLNNDGDASQYWMVLEVMSLTLLKVPTTIKATATDVVGHDLVASTDATKASQTSGQPMGQPAVQPAVQPKANGQTQSRAAAIGAIAGGVVGGVAAIAVLAALFFVWRKKQAKNVQRPNENTPFETDSELYWAEPYVDNVPDAAVVSQIPRAQPQPGGPNSRITSLQAIVSSKLTGQTHHLATDGGSFGTDTPAGEMPPTYDPAWSNSRATSGAAVGSTPGSSTPSGYTTRTSTESPTGPAGGAPASTGGGPVAAQPQGRVIGGRDRKG